MTDPTMTKTVALLPELVERVARAIDGALPESNNLTLAPSQIRRAAIAAIEATRTETDLKPGSYFEAMKAASDEIQQLREEVERLREALEPFSKAADMADERMIGRYGEAALLDDTTLLGALNITLGHVRRARSSLSSAPVFSHPIYANEPLSPIKEGSK